MPQKKLLISAILPKYDKSYAPDIVHINRNIYAASQELNFDLIFNKQFQLDGDINRSLYARDLLHLNFKGVAQLAMNFKYRLRKFTNIK